MATLLTGATLIELEPSTVEVANLRIDGPFIVARGTDLVPVPGDEVIDVSGKVVMSGLVCSHHHLYSALARGMPPPAQKPAGFVEILERIWWKLDRALDLDAVQLSATVGGLDALVCGTTTVIDHHASPRAIRGSLARVAAGLSVVGLRGVLAYEVTDRHGAVGREEGLEENVDFCRAAKGRFRGLVGAHASFTLSRDALEGLRQATAAAKTGLHIHLAEATDDERISFAEFGAVPVQRLAEHELLSPEAVLAHAVHLSWPDLSQVISSGAWLVHNPRSNMNNDVGYAPAGKFGARATLGTDGIGADMFAEAQLAYFRSVEAGQPIDPLRYLANGQRLAAQRFGSALGSLREGSLADLLVLDYRSPTPLTVENLAGHLVYGMSARAVESVMIDGLWRLWARRPLALDADALLAQSREVATGLWARMAELD